MDIHAESVHDAAQEPRKVRASTQTHARTHGGAAYAAAWHRYAAVAEADSTTAALAPGRRALVQQYFLAIAPTESP